MVHGRVLKKTVGLVWMCLLLIIIPLVSGIGVQNVNAANPNGEYKIVGYFPSWGIYGRSYNVSNIDVSKVTHINYAFADICWEGKHGNGSTAIDNPNKQTWPCTTTGIPLQSGNVPNGSIVLGDPDADALRPTPGGPTTGCWADAACGNFGALRNLKAQNPHLKTILSVGGWTWSNRFSDTAASDQTRKNFAKSAVDALRAYGFDGIDLDWEYPNVEAIQGNSYRPEDKQNYTLLLQETRNQLDAAGAEDGKQYLLTIASGASQKFVDNTELNKIAQIVDWINIMAYDFHGGSFEDTTSHNTGLYGDPNDPYYSNNFFVDGAIKAYKNAGVPLNKIVLGLEFMGRSWKNCPPGPNNDGQYQTCAADNSSVFKWAPNGTWDDSKTGNTGVFDYGDIAANYVNKNGYTRYYNSIAKVPYLYNPTTKIFISYDDTESIGYKTEYIKNNNLGGAMFWEFSSDCRTSPKFNCTGPKLLDKVAADLSQATPPADTVAPTAPTNLVETGHGDKKVTLSWGASTDNVGVMAYDIYRNGTLVQSVDGATTTALIKGLTGSTTYIFTVKARDAAGNSSAASNALSVTTSPPIIDNQPPTTPTNLVSLAKTKTTVKLSWGASTDNDDIAGYDIYQNGTLVKTTENTTETLTGLSPGTTYNFHVKAKDLSGNSSAASNSIYVTTPTDPVFPAWKLSTAYALGDYVTYNGNLYKCTYAHTSIQGWEPSAAPTLWQLQSAPPADTQPPSAPTNLAISAQTATSATLTWTASTDNIGVTGYDIYQGSNLIGSSATTTYTATGLPGGSAISFYVKAKDAAGNVSAASNTVTTTPTAPDTTPPTAPANLTFTAKTQTSVTLAWGASTDNVGVTGYDVYNGSTLAASVNGTTLTAVINNLTPGTAYTFTVKAKDAAGNVSTASNAVTVTTDTSPSVDTTPPTAPANLTSTAKTQTSVTLAWGASTDNVGVTGYDVYNGSTLAASVNGTTLTAVINNLTPDTAYTFTVKAKDAAGNVSAASNAMTVTTDAAPSVDTTPPTAPANLTSTAKTQTSVTLAWEASTDNVGVTGYDVYNGSSLAASVNGTTLTAVINNLTPGTAYTFTVKAKDAAGNVSTASNALTVTTDASTPTAAAWVANKAYVKDDLVTYNGKVYKCIQPHTSLAGWEPSNVPALWSVQP
ncbi:glycosyl hydrolase family 18 protein [Paenibacillus solani]|uniref:glycosyl hydrolase family 18 protein n=1 Tax=Paenibacillus solani TaxID=1705565 RepID=UPI003D2C472A